MKKLFVFLSISLVLFSCKNKINPENEKIKELKNLTQYVNPFIGTGDHGHVFMGVDVPFGMVQLGPVNISQGWDWCSGYHISDSTIMGFSHTHLSGTGIGDLGDIAFMPITGQVKFGRGAPENPASGMYSLFSHASEKARPGYYSVHLDRYDIDVELTATHRVGFHKYTFPKNASAPSIIIDLINGIGWDAPVGGSLIWENDTTISGYRHSSGWAKDQKVFFTAIFSKSIKNFEVNEEKRGERKLVHGELNFDLSDDKTLYAKVALSSVSIENAKINMAAELPAWDFEKTVKEADFAWNQELNKIDFETKDMRQKTIFYTALYHTMIAPSEFCDVNKDYYGTDKQIYKQAPFTNYTTFSLWDTYRAAHPLMTIIHPEKMPDIVNTMLAIYKEQGKLPVWHLVGNETQSLQKTTALKINIFNQLR